MTTSLLYFYVSDIMVQKTEKSLFFNYQYLHTPQKVLEKKSLVGINPFFIPDQIMGRPFVLLTFEFVDLCYHSNESSLVEVLHSTVKLR